MSFKPRALIDPASRKRPTPALDSWDPKKREKNVPPAVIAPNETVNLLPGERPNDFKKRLAK